jgi:hypothetical protein
MLKSQQRKLDEMLELQKREKEQLQQAQLSKSVFVVPAVDAETGLILQDPAIEEAVDLSQEQEIGVGQKILQAPYTELIAHQALRSFERAHSHQIRNTAPVGRKSEEAEVTLPMASGPSQPYTNFSNAPILHRQDYEVPKPDGQSQTKHGFMSTRPSKKEAPVVSKPGTKVLSTSKLKAKQLSDEILAAEAAAAEQNAILQQRQIQLEKQLEHQQQMQTMLGSETSQSSVTITAVMKPRVHQPIPISISSSSSQPLPPVCFYLRRI